MPKDTLTSYTPVSAMRRAHAAMHVGLSASHFDKLVAAGIMPTPRLAGGVKLWLRSELEFALLELEQEERGLTLCTGIYDLNI